MYDGPYTDGPFGGPFGAVFGPDSPLAVLLLSVVAVFVVFRILRGRTSPPGGGPGISGSLLEALSVLVVGVLVAFFVGFGVQAFYPAPVPPQFENLPDFAEPPAPPPKQEVERDKAKEEFREGAEIREEQFVAYQEELSNYNRVAAPVVFGIAILILLAVPLLLRRLGIPAIRDGAALGGVLTLLYGLVLALEAEGDVFRFLMVAVVLVVVLVAVYLRFRPERSEASAG